MTGFQKIWFRLQQDEDGYPPAQVESTWATPSSDGMYVLENTPFFAHGVSLGDVVSIEEDAEGRKWVKDVVKSSGHSTIRVIVFQGKDSSKLLEERVGALRQRFNEVGCTTELSHISGLFAVDVPMIVDYNKVCDLLAKGKDEGWDYEEASLRHPA